MKPEPVPEVCRVAGGRSLFPRRNFPRPRVAFDQKRADDTFLTPTNAALTYHGCVRGNGAADDGGAGGRQISVGGRLLYRREAAGSTPSASDQTSLFDRDIALIARALGRDLGRCYLSSLGCTPIASALPSPH